ncbi:MAG: PH domain-containing protein [Sphingomonas sp.]|nr:PH domain-containing protein [Sphingomonas sp.]
MPSFEEVKQQLSGLDNRSTVLGRKEIAELPKILWEGETIRGAIQGFYNSRIGLLVSTDRRLIFVDKGWARLKVEDFPYDKITSIQYEVGWLFGDITIFASGNRAEIKQLAKDQARPFAEKVRNMISGGQFAPRQGGNPVVESAPEDLVSQLERLAKLRDQGILTEAEFAQQKALILERMSSG